MPRSNGRTCPPGSRNGRTYPSRSGHVYGPAYGVIGSDGPPKLPLCTGQQNQPPYLVRQAYRSVRSQSSQRTVGPS